MKRTRTMIVTLLVALATATVSGGEFFVSPTGSDAGPGTKDRPFATVARGWKRRGRNPVPTRSSSARAPTIWPSPSISMLKTPA